MTTSDNDTEGKKLKLKSRGKLELNKKSEQGQVKQSFSHGRSKSVAVEVKRKRTYQRPDSERGTEGSAARGGGGEGEAPATPPASQQEAPPATEAQQRAQPRVATQAKRSGGRDTGDTETLERAESRAGSGGQLTDSERQARLRALEKARREAEEEERRKKAEAEERSRREAEEAARRKAEEEEERRRREAEMAPAPEETASPAPDSPASESPASESPAPDAPAAKSPEADAPAQSDAAPDSPAAAPAAQTQAEGDAGRAASAVEDAGGRVKRPKSKAGAKAATPAAPAKKGGGERRKGKLTINQALEGEDGTKQRSLAAMRRRQEREKQRQRNQQMPQKVVREVVVPDAITVGDLAQRMATRGADVVKALMKMGTMATVNQTIDAETAEVIVEDFGHKAKRVSDSDVEWGMRGDADRDEDLRPRPPVVTVMGHVDHGKTSLLDALRKTDVVRGEAGGITQHIGAYQVKTPSGNHMTFIDTPGHAAFTEMRSRGADVTDLVILVVAADDGIKDQTVEALNHAKASGVPMIVAINKCDKPQADPDRVRQELLNYEIVTEEMGGETLAVEVSAITGDGLAELDEAVALQAEILDLKANPNRPGEGAVIEAKLEKGRGPVATVLVQRGTLKRGDIFVAGAEWGRVRALVDDRGQQIKAAGPSVPVEVLGLQGTPKAGDEVVVVYNEQRAREIAEYRQEKQRQKEIGAQSRGSLEQMLSRIKEGEAEELPIVIKADVQGSLEAIEGALTKMGNDEVKVRILHAGVGGINESDITLAGASNAAILAFNVRANGKAREVAQRDGVSIRYYSVIYNLVDDVKAALEGMLAPHAQENFIGYAEIRQVFNITKVGKVAGCRVTEGVVKRGAGVRLLRDNVVIYEGALKTLKRFKDEVKEVKDGYECGIALENFNDLQERDLLECYEVQQVDRTL